MDVELFQHLDDRIPVAESRVSTRGHEMKTQQAAVHTS